MRQRRGRKWEWMVWNKNRSSGPSPTNHHRIAYQLPFSPEELGDFELMA